MRKALGLLLLFTAAGCGQAPNREESTADSSVAQNAATADLDASGVAERSAGPNVGVTAAPGVAFNYRYAFRLPEDRVQTVQEQHAQACEKLGVARCRITAMRYTLVRGEDIEAMLAFKLDPAIAREFGKQGIDAVVRAEGGLVDAEISGEDVGTPIAAARRREGGLEEELKRVEAQLARPGIRGYERGELQAQAQRIRDEMDASRTTRAAQQEMLATTPMVFNYGSGDSAPGFRGRPSFARALDDAIDNFLGGLAWIFVAVITLLPWVLMAALLVWAGRKLARRFSPTPTPEA